MRVTCSSNVGQGNGGTSLPCAGCFVQPAIANTEVVKMNIDVAASATLGVDLQRPHINDGTDEYGAAAAQPLWVPIDDVASLYFYSADANAIIDIMYLKGS
ncbi:MAG: hypothetical protein GY938_30890 [Ketobacter sp.]|nr:hypothetical protein [Ketobacter sp.]